MKQYTGMKGTVKGNIIAGLVIAVILGILIALLVWSNSTGPTTSSGTGGDRTMGRCWICGKKGSFQLDGSYYCFEHYNQRLNGDIG